MVADINTIKKIAIAFVAVSVEPRNVEESGAPKKLASLADTSYSPFNRPRG